MINIFQATMGAEELAAVEGVFASSWVGRGPRTAEFESAFATHIGVGADRVTSLNSCTEALFTAMELAGVGRGDEVVLPTISFVSAGNAIAARGARPVFCDVEPRTLAPTAEDVAAAIGPRTRAAIVLHYGGHPGHIREIAALCRERGVLLVEDTACSVSSRVGGMACGTVGDIGVWSFDGQKILVCGDGSMLTARDPELVARARKIAYLGLAQVSGFAQAKVSDRRWWDIDISSFSRRSIMNDIQSAIGLVQLGRLAGFVERRRAITEHYDREFAELPGVLRPPALPAGHESSYYLYWTQLDPRIRDAVARDLYEAGVYTTFKYYPLHRVALYGSHARLPRAEAAAEQTLCLPLHNGLRDSEVDTVVTALRASVTARSRRLGPTRAAA